MGPLGERYDIIAPIGAGTAANVFRVRDQRSGVVRAAKVLKPENARVPGILARFENEYRILRNLHHPHLPEVYDYGRTGEGGRFLVMELVDGEPLDAYFKTHPRDLWVILHQLCEIFSFIHNHDLLHLDVKPSNILVKRTTAFGDELPLVKLIDFGVTYRRDAGERAQLVGTPDYIAPEVALGESPLTRAVDHYSLGVTLYELLVGHVPFMGSVGEVLRAHVEQEPLIEHEELEWAELYPHVRSLLAKDKKTRLAAFEELRRAVVTRLTGGITALDRAYGAARIESMGMIGKAQELRTFLDATLPENETVESKPWRISVSGQPLSGRGHFLDDARSEWRIHGVASWQLGENSDAAWLFNRAAEVTGPPTEKDFEQAWARVARVAADGPAWVVASGDLAPDESRLYEYFETGRTLAGPDVRRNLGFVTATATDRGRPEAESDDVVRITLPTLTAADVDSILGRFRGEMLRAADTQLLADVLKDLRESGEVILLLRRLIAEGGLIFEAQRWRVTAERVHAIARAPVPRGGHLTLPLSPSQKQLMVCLASHPGAVPVGWLPDLSGLDDTDAVKALHDLRLRHLLEPVDLGGTAAVRTTSRAVEQAVLRDADDTTLRGIHARYVDKLSARALSGALAPPDRLRTLALHQERSGDERNAYLTRRQLFKELWEKRAYGEIEQICRDAMAPEMLRFGLARAYLRELIKVLWAQNLTTRAYHDMKAFTDRYGEVPKGLLPKYARGLMDALGPQEGLNFIESSLRCAETVSRRLWARLQVERALCLYNLSRYDEGLKAVLEARRIEQMIFDETRLCIYEAILNRGVGRIREWVRVLEHARVLAREHGLADELSLVEILRANEQIDKGNPDEALRMIAAAMRGAHKSKAILRQYQLLSQAASAYSEVGEHDRAVRCRERTVVLAQYLGQPAMIASSWWRVGHYAEREGAFGNAIRYFDRATKLLDGMSRPTDRAYAHVLNHELHDYIGSDREKALAQIAEDAIHLTPDIGEQGTLEILVGGRLMRRGRYVHAASTFEKAREKNIKAGRKDEAMRAAAGHARAVLMLGRTEECREILKSADMDLASFANADVLGQRYLSELLYLYYARASAAELAEMALRCKTLTEKTYMHTRLDIYCALMRTYARMDKKQELADVRLQYEGAIRSIVANLESNNAARRFLTAIGYISVAREMSLVEKRSAHVLSADAGTVRPV